jgi:hypothetical protein
MSTKKVILYYQTFTTLKPILFPGCPITHIHLSAIHFGNDSKNRPYIHLNDHPPDDSRFSQMWSELKIAHNMGIKIVLMVGGAGSAYQQLFANFDSYYTLLHDLMKSKKIIQGIDLDIEETVTLDDVRCLIRRVRTDFGENFIISTAPIQSSLESDTPGMGGFIYKDLFETEEGKTINYINGQFYGDYSLESYDMVVKNGYKPENVVMGMLSGQDYVKELELIVEKYGNKFGGVFIWEYFDIQPNALEWIRNIQEIYGLTSLNDSKCILS